MGNEPCSFAVDDVFLWVFLCRAVSAVGYACTPLLQLTCYGAQSIAWLYNPLVDVWDTVVFRPSKIEHAP